MLMKSPDNVLPIEGSFRALGAPGRQIGAILVEDGKLTPANAERVLERQRKLGTRFGEAAIELNFITEADLRQALCKQYEFSYLISGADGVSRELVAACDPFNPCVEEIRALRTQLLIRWFDPKAGRRALTIASPGAREGRSYLAANLAVVFAQLGQRTLLIDADFRGPRQHSLFNLQNRVGLSSVLSGRGDLGAAAPIPELLGLSVLPAGPTPPNPLELLSRASFPLLFERAQAEFDVILVDTPAASQYADAQCAAFRTGNALLISRKNHTRVADTVRVGKIFSDAGSKVVGTLVNAF